MENKSDVSLLSDNAIQCFSKLSERLSEITKIFQPVFKQIALNLEKLPETTRIVNQYLAKRSWYLSMWHLLPKDIIHLAEMINTKEENEIENYIIFLVK